MCKNICDDILEKVSLSYHIDIYGNNSSMNVATSLAIATVSKDLLNKMENGKV